MTKIFIVGKGFLGEHLCRYFTKKYSRDRVLYFSEDVRLEILNKNNYNIYDLNSIFNYSSIDYIINSLEDIDFIQKLTKLSNIKQYHQIITKKNRNIKELLKNSSFKVTFSHGNPLYGPGQDKNELIPLWVNRIKKNKTIELKRNYLRDWLFVMDFCHAVEIILQHGTNGETYCISSEHYITDAEVVKEIINLLHKSQNLLQISTEEVVDKTQECSKIKELGWKEERNLVSGLELMIKWNILENFEERIKSIFVKAIKK